MFIDSSSVRVSDQQGEVAVTVRRGCHRVPALSTICTSFAQVKSARADPRGAEDRLRVMPRK
jgi:hypothetical protein